MRRKNLGTKGMPIPVIDLFAGPGGLGEGFSRACGGKAFKTVLSVEMDPHAHATLELRAMQRQFPEHKRVPDELVAFMNGFISREEFYARFPNEAESARKEALHRELGRDNDEIHRLIGKRLGARAHDGRWVLIGGPPCQAYSLAGRARNSRVKRSGEYRPETDRRNFLYREYLKIIARFKPAVFVMENVKGMLSSEVGGAAMCYRIINDLEHPSRAVDGDNSLEYELYPVGKRIGDLSEDSSPSSFIVECERYGVPQRRHRVIIVGIRKDFQRTKKGIVLVPEIPPKCRDVIYDLPRLRSRLTGRKDSDSAWRDAIRGADWRALLGLGGRGRLPSSYADIVERLNALSTRMPLARSGSGSTFMPRTTDAIPVKLDRWYGTAGMDCIFNHETRAHMASDLHRYLFAAVYAEINGVSPKLADFPFELLPDHRNAFLSSMTNRLFADRFRVQLRHEPATTITSHISKDGHGYIHYDPSQCRALTVREAARLQTFPDDYCFLGPRTAQYHQVGNAVPPYMAFKIATAIAKSMGLDM